MTRKRKPYPSPVSRRSSLLAGSEVEVRSNEDGFHGSWFEATITKNLAKTRRYAVAYTTLVSSSSDPPPAPLKEKVSRSMVRPRPPRPGPNRAYGLHHLVDAFHNDGWWAGVVSGLPGGGRDLYTVCFPSSREEFKFRTSELREQMQWLRGSWISLQDQQGGPDVMFGVGASVEVSRDNENYGAAWFVGTVLKIIGKKNFLVEYENLRVDGEDGNSGTLLKEIVDLQYIRPPPTSKSKKFNVLDEVEAYRGDGWYAATVLKILPGPRYVVNSKGEKVALDQRSIRCRCSWTGGVWLHFSQGKQLESQTSRGIKSAGCGRKHNNGKSHPAFELSSSNDSSEVANKSNFVMSKRKETDSPDSEIQTESSLHAPKKPKNGKLFRQPCQLADEMLRECIFQTEAKSVKSSYSENPLIVAIPALADTQGLQGTPERIPKSHGECTPVGNETADSLVSMDSSLNSNSRVSKCQLNVCSSLVPLGLEASEFTPFSGRGSCKGLHSSKDNTRMRRKKLVIRQKKPIDVVDARHHEEEETTERNRDKNQETRIVNMHASIERDGTSETRQEEERIEIVSGESTVDGVGIADKVLSGNIPPNVVLPRDHEVIECSSPDVTPPCCQHDEETQSENSLIISEKTFKADLSKQWTNRQQNFLEDSYLTPKMEPIRLAKFLHSTTQQSHHSVRRLFINDVNEMQICTFELAGAEREVRALVSSSQESILLNSNELVPSLLLSDRTTAMDSEETMIGANPSEPASDKIVPPFTKKSMLWKKIELDGAFRIMPQQPHFRQLEHYVMELREGMAIGLMVAYADLVSEIRERGVGNSPEDKLKALDSLESNGFNVQFLQDRLRKLLEMKDKLIQSHRQRVELEAQLVEREVERERSRILSSALDKAISDWEEHLNLVRMKRASIISNMYSNDFTILNLQRAAQANKEAIVSAIEQYNDALAAPW